jgi:transcription-repair coupling factor (superfamily II helicase)
MLEEKIEELASGKVRIPPCKIELDISYQIPESFFENEIDKISFFRDIESIETQDDLEMVYESFTRGYENIPEEMENFFLLMRTRILLQSFHVKSLKKIGMHYTCDFHENVKIETLKSFLETCDPKKYFALLSGHKARIDTRYFPSSIELLRYLRSE